MVENCMSGYNSCMFAYGQTGSGKTYTMMGEINQVHGELNVDCGITPRIFQHLFMRIKEEEENRKSEGLKYSCKCSFLEIYNEQITDLLEPSHNNLHLREDLKKGVYVENLSDYDVRSADDVLNLLREGAANRKIAATHMNNESSRSHSVFTCIIESHWERDSMNHFRFARLNLVDLAGSERQKISGAEGDRLKEAATINRSLSTLGLVIMSLVDLAQGKQRHVPYRDSRLTFLLQDSLGGNSKTTIIANVSPSVCSAGETLSTLKFAQRAKLIQNNAKVNEDASGVVSVLQQQIQQLKGQLNSLMKHQDTSKYTSNCSHTLYETAWSNDSKRRESMGEVNASDDDIASSLGDGKVKSLNSLLLGALRRENMAEMEIRRLKKELDQTNSLVYLHEEDARRNKMILEIQDKRIKELELCADGLLSADEQLLGENEALKEEMRLLQERVNENPDTTKFELEKMRLIEQLRWDQNFHEQGGRESLLTEVSELRDKLLELLEAEKNCWHQHFTDKYKDNTAKELDECRDMNSRLIWEVDELQRALNKHIEVIQDDEVQTQSTKSRGHENLTSSMKMKSKKTLLLEQLDSLRGENNGLTRMLHQKEKLEPQSGMESENYDERGSLVEWKIQDGEDVGIEALKERLDQMTILEEALLVNNQYLGANASRLTLDHQTESDCDGLQTGTTEPTNDFLKELIAIQSEFRERLRIIEQENTYLRKEITDKDYNMRALSAEWERATLELTGFLVDGSKYLRDASLQIVGISSAFPHVNIWLREHIERALKTCIQKEETILLLQHSLEEAQKTVLHMDRKLNSLKGATIAFAEAELVKNNDGNQAEEVIKLVNGVSFEKKGDVAICTKEDIAVKDLHAIVDSLIPEEVDNVAAVSRRAQPDSERILNALCSDMETHLSELQSEIVKVGENRLLQDQINSTTTAAKSIAWLEGAFDYLQNDLEELHHQAAYQDASGIVHETVNCIGSFKVMLEDIYTKALENEIIVFFLECHMKEFIRYFRSIDRFHDLRQLTLTGPSSESKSSEENRFSCGNCNMLYCTKEDSYVDVTPTTKLLESEELSHVYSDPVTEILELKRELQRKKVLLKGLLFDCRLLQEFASCRKDFKDEYEKLINTLNQVRYELQIKTKELNDLRIENQSLQVFLNETNNEFSTVKSDLEHAKETSSAMSEQNADLRMLIKDLYLKNSETEKQLKEEEEVVKNLEEEILRLTSSSEEKLFLSLGNSERDLETVAEEREKLLEQRSSLQGKLDMMYAVADENEAAAAEARQESEASKLYAEQKEEEVKILEHSIEELECTINVMEKKVSEMEEEVQRQHMLRETLELEMLALRKRLSTVENLSENLDFECSSVELSEGQNERSLKHYDLQSHVALLEDEKLGLTKEVKQCKAYIAELILHAEAQASQFQEKYKCLVEMLQDKKIESLDVTYEVPASEKTEKNLSRTRGSSSPFRCIANLVQQVNLEKDREQSADKLHIEELEALAVKKQKEVCVLKSRLAAAESMTHDVIRDLLGVKLDMTNLANLAEQHQLHKLVEEAQQQKVASFVQEEEILNLRSQIIRLTEERERCIMEINRRNADELATEISIERLKERDRLLTAQNDMLKVDKSNLQRRVAELDDMLKKLLETKDIHSQRQRHLGKQLTRVDVELARCRKYRLS
ncbi:hypothetical protein Leryth_016047 [Lithospermum erythrorhizon]|nr:hypothetical protein Leryth_016047 [Lithospermum erythrorhizon]